MDSIGTNTRTKAGSWTRRAAAAFGLLLLAAAPGARAQTLPGMMQSNADFDARMNAMLQGAMQRNQAAMQATQQAYMQQFGPQLQQSYVSSGANRQMSFQQYAYWMMMTANGTNIAGAQRAQQEQFAAMESAHQTQMQGFNSYNEAMARNSQAQTRAVENWDHNVVRGESLYANPQTGAGQWMQSYAPGQQQTYGGYNYVQDRNGNYWQQQGNGWVQVQPTGR